MCNKLRVLCCCCCCPCVGNQNRRQINRSVPNEQTKQVKKEPSRSSNFFSSWLRCFGRKPSNSDRDHQENEDSTDNEDLKESTLPKVAQDDLNQVRPEIEDKEESENSNESVRPQIPQDDRKPEVKYKEQNETLYADRNHQESHSKTDEDLEESALPKVVQDDQKQEPEVKEKKGNESLNDSVRPEIHQDETKPEKPEAKYDEQIENLHNSARPEILHDDLKTEKPEVKDKEENENLNDSVRLEIPQSDAKAEKPEVKYNEQSENLYNSPRQEILKEDPKTDKPEVKDKEENGSISDGSGTNSTVNLKILRHDVWPHWSNGYGRPIVYNTYFPIILEENEDLDSDDDWDQWNEDLPVIWPRLPFFKAEETFQVVGYDENPTVKTYPWTSFLLGLENSSVAQDHEVPVEVSQNSLLDFSSNQNTFSSTPSAGTSDLRELGRRMIEEFNDLASSSYKDKKLSKDCGMEPKTPHHAILTLDTNANVAQCQKHESQRNIQNSSLPLRKIRSKLPVPVNYARRR